ncbi:hypothetical protein NUW58_g7372 [Xylaria curta]|uniref:Uncharacterized protein n=1 Tax=Xylaria curta TaxID=42375 RepID=A0ACC1NIE4_9PEZI|nr:hypothetical protein NUW58_g7372 [Xylaria curta]
MASTSGPYFIEGGQCDYDVDGQTVWGGLQNERNPVLPRSIPPTTESSSLRTKMMSGLPAQFEAGRSQGSAPGNSSNDYYRGGLESKKTRHGPPLNSDFCRAYRDYKDHGLTAEVAEEQYKIHLGSASAIIRKEKLNNPGVYVDNPPETRD